MSGLLGLSGSLPLSLFVAFPSLPLPSPHFFPAIVYHTVFFLPFFQVSKCSCLIYLYLTLFQCAQFISSGTILLLSLFVWMLVSSLSAPLLSFSSSSFSFSLPWSSLLWCYFFPPLVRSLLLYLSLSPAFPSSLFLFPLCSSFLYVPTWFRGISLLTVPHISREAFPCNPAFSLLLFFLLFLASFFSSSFSMLFAFLCSRAYLSFFTWWGYAQLLYHCAVPGFTPASSRVSSAHYSVKEVRWCYCWTHPGVRPALTSKWKPPEGHSLPSCKSAHGLKGYFMRCLCVIEPLYFLHAVKPEAVLPCSCSKAGPQDPQHPRDTVGKEFSIHKSCRCFHQGAAMPVPPGAPRPRSQSPGRSLCPSSV